MDWFTIIKGYYDKGLWSKGQVWDAVGKGKVTETQYTEITGDIYPTVRPA